MPGNKQDLSKRLRRVPVPKRPADERIYDFEEVALGYGEEEAYAEVARCLQCSNPTCIKGCPVEIDIKAFCCLLNEGDLDAAIAKIKEKNSLPGICGRVCPQEVQCETQCILNKRGAPIAIGALERFLADYEAEKGIQASITESTGRRVAVVGSGPAGLTVAGDLAKIGHEIVIYEALHKPGGVLTYGIPEFRLPKKIVEREIEYIKRLGVRLEVDVIVGRTMTIQDLFEDDFEAIFIGNGAGSPLFLNIQDENLNGVYTANEFLTRCNLMKAYVFGEYDTPIDVRGKVVVIGGGNVAVDSSRVALRCGVEEVSIVYRRSEVEMPARVEEVENAKEEGVKLNLLMTPVRVLGEGNHVNNIECINMRLGEPDSGGRRRPVPIKGSNYLVPCDTLIIAIGRSANTTITQMTPELKTNPRGLILTDGLGRTSMKGVWSGGDVVTGEATVISAMGAGRKSAMDIDRFLGSQ